MSEHEFITQNIGPLVELSAESRRLLDNRLFGKRLLREIHENSSIAKSGLLRKLPQINVGYRQHLDD